MSMGRAEVVAAGQRHAGLAGAGQQRAEHHDGRPHLLDELVRRLGQQITRVGDGQLRAGGVELFHPQSHGLEQLAHDPDVGDAAARS
jgi:hypothetical protein